MRVRLTLTAKAQLQSAFEYIAADSPAGAAAVVARIEHSLSLIAEFPEIGRRGAESETREFAVPRTPYVLIYRVTDQIEVAAVLHGRQRK